MAEDLKPVDSAAMVVVTPSQNTADLAATVAKLEQTVASQSDEIVLLKSALADAIRKINALEERKSTNVTPGKSKRPVSASDNTFTHSTKKESQKSVTSTSVHSYSTPTRSSTRTQSANDSGTKKSQTKRKPSTSALTKDEQAERDGASVKFQLRGRSLNLYAPSNVNEENSTGEPPDKKLELEWVHGYRGKDCRNNLYYLPSNEVLYNTAAVVVLYNSITKTQRHYTEHTDDIKCLALHKNKEIVGSGQIAGHTKKEGKPHVRIWSAVTLQTLKVIGLGIFQRGLACIAFSIQDNGQHLVAIDEANDHVLSVWDWENKKKLVEAKGGNEPVLAVDFHLNDSKRIVSCGKSHIAFWKITGDKKIEKKLGVFEKHAKPKYMLCFAFGQNGEVISGDSNGNIFIWEDGNTTISQEITAAHEGPIFSIENDLDGLFVTGGGKDKKVFIWDNNYNKTEKQFEVGDGAVRSAIWGPVLDGEKSVLVGTTKNAIIQFRYEGKSDNLTQGHSEETWGLSASSKGDVFITCGYDKRLYLWSSKFKSLVWSQEMSDPLQSVCQHPFLGLVAVATQNNKVFVLDSSNGEEYFKCEIGSEQVDCIKYSPDGTYLAVGSHDNFVYLFTVSDDGKQYKKHGRLAGHSSYITHLDWSKDSQYLQTNSGDYELLYWQAKESRQVSSAFSMRDVEWDTWSCVLGYPVRGMWPEGADGTDINTCIRSYNGKYLANGDDSGNINLFSYPCVKTKSQGNVARGHSSHVTAVRFLATDEHLVSVGGKDNTVMQWKVVSI